MTPRDRLLEAKGHLSAALAIVDDVAPDLPEPERSVVCGIMGLRDDLSRIVRALGTIATTVSESRGQG